MEQNLDNDEKKGRPATDAAAQREASNKPAVARRPARNGMGTLYSTTENQQEKGRTMETHFGNMEHTRSALARERVVEDLKSLVRDSEDLLKATAGDASEKAKEARSRMTHALERAKATCEELQEQTVAAAKAAAKRADTVIRGHPYESIGAAFGVGLLIGVLVTRH